MHVSCREYERVIKTDGYARGATVEQMFDNLKGSIRKLRETVTTK